MGTIDRADDSIAAFSSRGPGAVDYGAKPDVVAPGVGIESLSDPASFFYNAKAAYLLPGSVHTPYLPYLSLSGTSMAAPVVSGTVALLLQANPALTPNEIKAILQYTAQTYAGYDALTQGAGFVNAKGAVDLARFLAAPATAPVPDATAWARHVIWGNHRFAGGWLTAGANAWPAAETWGAPATASGAAIQFGVICRSTECDASSAWEPWAVNAESSNVVWGSSCGGADCSTAWSPGAGGDAVRPADDGDTVVWGTGDEGDTVVWGTSGDEGDTVVWGTSCTDPSCQPVIWE
jgi:serine protease AprX